MTPEEKEKFKAMQHAILEMSNEIALLKYSLLHEDSRPDGVPISRKEPKFRELGSTAKNSQRKAKRGESKP